MIQHLTEIVEEARKRGKKRLAVAYGQDSHTLEAVYEAYKEGLVEPTLFGEKSVIEQVCAENDIDIRHSTSSMKPATSNACSRPLRPLSPAMPTC